MADRTRALIGALLVLAGVVFLLDAADIVPARQIIGGWWPLIIIALGVFAMFGRPGSLTGGGILVAIGAVLLLATLDVLEISLWQLIIPLILIGAGLSLVIRGLGRGRTPDLSNRVNMVGVLSEQHIVSESTGFQNASLTSVLGEVKLDLRNAQLDPRGAKIDAVCIMGDVSILVPRGWRIHVNGLPILGDFQDETDHYQELEYNAPELTVTGVSILADVDIKHG